MELEHQIPIVKTEHPQYNLETEPKQRNIKSTT